MRECIKILLHSPFYDMLKKDTTKGLRLFWHSPFYMHKSKYAYGLIISPITKPSASRSSGRGCWSDHDIEVARFEDILQVVVIEFQGLRSDGERNLAALSGFKSNALEALQFFHGTAHARYEVAYVELNNLCGIHVACVCNRYGSLNAACRRHLRGTELQVGVAECGV